MKNTNDPSPTELRIPIEAGLCELVFRTYNTTGKNPNTRPGIAFDCEASWIMQRVQGANLGMTGEFYLGGGVLARDEAAKLRDYLDTFLKECPPV